jgi:ABC-2 type transport system ATP-binding protein
MPEAAIELCGLTKHFPLPWQRKRLVALNHLDLRVEPGEVIGLLGPNGSGKSTTMKLLLGLIRPTSGEARVFGHSTQDLEARRRLGFLPENPYFHKFLNADETLRFYGRLCGLRAQKLQARIDELIDLVGLQSSRRRPLRSYSKGMLQRVGLAQALMHDPELVLLDEPTAGVDPLGAHEIKRLIQQLKRLGKTVVFSSHLLDEVEAVADRVAIMHLGHKILEGRLADLLQVRSTTQITVQNLPESAWPSLQSNLEQTGGSQVEFRTSRMSLEQLYVQTVQSQIKDSHG